METRARQLGHMTARMVCGFICVLLMSRFMFYCGFTCVLFMMSFRCVYDSLVFAFMLRLRCFMLVLYVFGLCKALSLRSGSYRRSPLGLPKKYVESNRKKRNNDHFLSGMAFLIEMDDEHIETKITSDHRWARHILKQVTHEGDSEHNQRSETPPENQLPGSD